MARRKVAQQELERDEKYQPLYDELTKLYFHYLDTGSSDTMDRITLLVMDLNKDWVKASTFSYDDEQDVLLVGTTKAFLAIRRSREDPEKYYIDPKSLPSYVHRIFENELTDLIRRRKKRKLDEDEVAPDKMRPISLDVLPDEFSDEAVSALLTFLEAPKGDVFDQVTREERAALFHDILVEYCRVIMTVCKTDLEHALSLFYARIIPHVEDLISERIATSTKWAWGHMKGKSFLFLTDESETSVQRNIDSGLAWGDPLRGQLEADCFKVTPVKPYKAVVTEEVITAQNIGHWSKELHDKAKKKLFAIIREDPVFVSRAKAYIENTDRSFGSLLYGRKAP